MQQRIQFARTSDGVMIALASTGEGPAVVWTFGWVSHLEFELQYPPAVREFEQLSRGGRRRLVRFDVRGTGLSDRDVRDLSCLARARDFEAVVDHLGLEQVTIFASSMTGPPAIVYAATHPEKVSKLILYGSFARNHGEKPALGRALVDLIRAEWNLGSRAIVDLVDPHADKATADLIAGFFKAAASAETAAAILEESLFEVDVRGYLPRLAMPVLVLHRRDDPAFSFDHARELAALLPNAQLVPLPGDAHLGSQGDTQSIMDAVDVFLGDEPPGAPAVTAGAAGLHIILFTDIEGSTNVTQRLGDAKAQELLRTHDGIVRDALRRHGGTEVKHTGDGIMATFSTASTGIECAVAIQRALAAHNREHPDTPIRVRIGLNAGEPVAERRDLFGTTVQAAARIATYAEPGQILAADVVRQLAAGKGFPFANRGRVRLKGFDHRFRLYEVEWEEPA